MGNRSTFRAAIEARDLNRAVASFEENAVLHSPISFKPIEGRAAIGELLGVLSHVFENFHYTDELESADGTEALIFRARVGDREIEGLDLIRFGEAGLIRDLTVMVRPRSGMEALMAAAGPRLVAARASKGLRAKLGRWMATLGQS